jgi:hypothetical protein
MARRTKAEEAERNESLAMLRGMLCPGDTVFVSVKHVARSGMSRIIQPRVIRPDAEGNGRGVDVRFIGWHVAKVLGWRYDREHEGIKVHGCGMDMGFHLVYSLSYVLFPDGFGEKCWDCSFRPDTKEEAAQSLTLAPDEIARGVTPHRFRGRNGDTSGWDEDGGYALKHQWI